MTVLKASKREGCNIVMKEMVRQHLFWSMKKAQELSGYCNMTEMD
jgi:hypothetical protein